jgi:hypothetical protein
MTLGSTLAGSISSGQAAPSPGSNHATANPGKAAGKAASADEPLQDRRASRADSFSDILNGNVDPAGKQVARHDPEGSMRHWNAKENSPWRSLDPMKPHRQEDDSALMADQTEEVELASDTGLALAISIHQTIFADDGTGAPSTDMPRGAAIALIARGGADGSPADARGQPRRQGTVPETRGASASPIRSETQAEPASEKSDVKVSTNTGPLPADQSREVRRASPTTTPADRSEPRVTVLSSQVLPAPAVSAPSLSPTGAAFVASLKSEGALPQHAAEAASLALEQQSASARPVTTLKIQLHPAELGAVTVKLTGSGEQLAIEVRVENSEARHQLSSDSETIVKALRGMGYDIDRITVHQAPSTSASPGGGTNRENTFTAQDGRSGDRQDQSWRRESGQQDDQNARGNSAGGSDRGEARSGGVYI